MDMSEALKSLKDEVLANDRLRYGLWTVLLIVLLYISLVMGDAMATVEEEYVVALTRLDDVSSVATQKQWSARADLTAELVAELSSRLWQSSSEGHAAATFRTWLDKQLATVQLSGVKVQMLPVEPRSGPLGLWKVSARLRGNMAVSPLQRFLFLCENNTELVVIDSVTIRNGSRKNLDAVVTAWFQQVER